MSRLERQQKSLVQYFLRYMLLPTKEIHFGKSEPPVDMADPALELCLLTQDGAQAFSAEVKELFISLSVLLGPWRLTWVCHST